MAGPLCQQPRIGALFMTELNIDSETMKKLADPRGLLFSDDVAGLVDRYEALLIRTQEQKRDFEEVDDAAEQAGYKPAVLKRAAQLRLDRQKKERAQNDMQELIAVMAACGTPLEIEG